MLTVGSLFSGIGGIDLGLERAGMRVIWQCEVDPYCQTILRRHWPNTPIYDDITTTDWSSVDRPAVVSAGFPCQPFSTLGKQKGTGDDRYLWPEIVRVLRGLGPRYVVLENVPALKANVAAFGTILADLSSLGFDAEWSVVSACSVGATHLRKRLFILAYPGGARRREVTGRAPGDEGADERWAEEEDHVFVGHVASPRWEDWWASEPDVDRMADGVPHQLDRLRVLGNAVVPQVAEVVGRRIVEAEMQRVAS